MQPSRRAWCRGGGGGGGEDESATAYIGNIMTLLPSKVTSSFSATDRASCIAPRPSIGNTRLLIALLHHRAKCFFL